MFFSKARKKESCQVTEIFNKTPIPYVMGIFLVQDCIINCPTVQFSIIPRPGYFYRGTTLQRLETVCTSVQSSENTMSNGTLSIDLLFVSRITTLSVITPEEYPKTKYKKNNKELWAKCTNKFWISEVQFIPQQTKKYHNILTTHPQRTSMQCNILQPTIYTPKHTKITHILKHTQTYTNIHQYKPAYKGNRTIADLRYGVKDIISTSTLIFHPIKG